MDRTEPLPPAEPLTLLSDVASTVINACPKTMSIEEKRRLNSKAPISGLPPEVLSLIFSNVRDSYLDPLARTEGFCLGFEKVGSELWIDFTHVCHDWREIALANPTLWTRIVSIPNNHKWTQEFLLRSKRCLLTPCIIEGRLDSDTSAHGRGDLIKHLDRCHCLTMGENSSNDLQNYLSSKVDALHLNHLVIHADEQDPSSSKVPFILSDSHLHAPSLRRLELENCGVDWKSGFLSHLTHLRLEDLPIDSQLRCRDFVKTLANMPFLEHIFLCYECMRNEDTAVSFSDKNLPTSPYWRILELLDMADSVRNIARFLNNILLHPMTKLCLYPCDNLHDARPFLPSLFDWISNHLVQSVANDCSGSVLQNCLRSFVLCDLNNDFTMQGFKHVIHMEGQGQDINAVFQFTFPYHEEVVAASFREVVERILIPPIQVSISSIVCLEVYSMHFDMSQSCWSTIFGSIPTLESIRVRCSGRMSFFHALLPGITFSDDALSTSMPFRALKSIGIYIDKLPIHYFTIGSVLRTRLELGFGVQEFVFFTDGPLPSSDALSLLVDLVPSVGLYYDPAQRLQDDEE